jgi:hypothetical protein
MQHRGNSDPCVEARAQDPWHGSRSLVNRPCFHPLTSTLKRGQAKVQGTAMAAGDHGEERKPATDLGKWSLPGRTCYSRFVSVVLLCLLARTLFGLFAGQHATAPPLLTFLA